MACKPKYIMTQATKDKIAASRRGKVHNAETRKNISHAVKLAWAKRLAALNPEDAMRELPDGTILGPEDLHELGDGLRGPRLRRIRNYQ